MIYRIIWGVFLIFIGVALHLIWQLDRLRVEK